MAAFMQLPGWRQTRRRRSRVYLWSSPCGSGSPAFAVPQRRL